MRVRMIIPASLMLAGLMAFAGNTIASPNHVYSRSDRVESRFDKKRLELKRTHVRGTITEVRGQVAYIEAAPGDVRVVRLGPESYWQQRGYRLVPGQRILVTGWYDPYRNSDVIFASKISGPGVKYIFTTRAGEPLWETNYAYGRGWRPTYTVYETWYSPDYRYAVARAPEPAPARVEKERSEDYSHAKSSDKDHSATGSVKKAAKKSAAYVNRETAKAKHYAKKHLTKHHHTAKAKSKSSK